MTFSYHAQDSALESSLIAIAKDWPSQFTLHTLAFRSETLNIFGMLLLCNSK